MLYKISTTTFSGNKLCNSFSNRSSKYLFSPTRVFWYVPYFSQTSLCLPSRPNILKYWLQIIRIKASVYTFCLFLFMAEPQPHIEIWFSQLYGSLNGRRVPKDSRCKVKTNQLNKKNSSCSILLHTTKDQSRSCHKLGLFNNRVHIYANFWFVKNYGYLMLLS